MSFAIPVKRLRETSNLIAFHHPSPSYKVHILLVPKRQVQTLADLDLKAYRLIVNGGEYQDFPHLHFHLISDT